MQLPSERTPTPKCVELGAYSQRMLGKFPDNAALSPLSHQVGATTQALAQAQAIYDGAMLQRTAARVEVEFASYSAVRHVRTLQRLIELADGVKKGKLASSVLPDGVTPIVRLVGASQVTELRALEGRLEAMSSEWEAAAGEKAKIASERQRYEEALALRRSAFEDVEDLRARRDAAKQQFLDVYAQVTAHVKAAFPRNRVMQDLFFDELLDRGRRRRSRRSRRSRCSPSACSRSDHGRRRRGRADSAPGCPAALPHRAPPPKVPNALLPARRLNVPRRLREAQVRTALGVGVAAHEAAVPIAASLEGGHVALGVV